MSGPEIYQSALIPEILTLYGWLEGISKMEDKHSLKEKELNDIVDAFYDFFEKKTEQRKLDILCKDIILQGTITDTYRIGNQHDEKEPDSDINGNSLLLSAMSIPSKRGTMKHKKLQKIINLLIEKCPGMILLPNINKDFKGITPLHVAVLKGDIDRIESMSKKLLEAGIMGDASRCIAEGPVFHKTAMMAGTLLGVASLMCDKKVFRVVLEQFPSELDNINHKGDNIVHSLIKYAHVQQDKSKNVEALDMLKYIIDCKFTKGRKDKTKHSEIISKLLMMKNKERLTPLQVAAKREQFDFFKSIMQHEDFR